MCLLEEEQDEESFKKLYTNYIHCLLWQSTQKEQKRGLESK